MALNLGYNLYLLVASLLSDEWKKNIEDTSAAEELFATSLGSDDNAIVSVLLYISSCIATAVLFKDSHRCCGEVAEEL